MRAIAILCLLSLVCCSPFSSKDKRSQGWYSLRWAEKPSSNGPSKHANPEDCTEFKALCSFDQAEPKTFQDRKHQLREGDVIAYWMRNKDTSKSITKGKFNTVGYGMLSHGHLAIVVKDRKRPGKLLLFSSQSFKGPNTDESIDTLADHSWDAYRLDKWDRVDKPRFYEFVDLSMKKAGNWRGYDFTGMFGLWNSGIEPTCPEEIGGDYICSTVVVAALHYAGLKLDAVNRHGVLDLISPKQVVTSHGCFVPLPEVEIEVVELKHEHPDA